MKQLRFAVLSTVSYAAVFRQALTVEQIHFFLIRHKASSAQVKKIVAHLVHQKKLTVHNHHYFLPAYPPRHEDQTIVDQKYQLANRAIRLLSWIATIQLIAVSGAVGAGSPQRNDDIDLFIITKSQCLWISRLCAVVLLELLGLRRRPRDRHAANKICLNFFLDRKNLPLPVSDQTLYGAHEVVQMKPLWSIGNIYRDFLDANSWVSQFLPHAYDVVVGQARRHSLNNPIRKSVSFLLSLCEGFARTIQWWYMKNHRKHEVIETGIARFHPSKTSSQIAQYFAAIQRTTA